MTYLILIRTGTQEKFSVEVTASSEEEAIVSLYSMPGVDIEEIIASKQIDLPFLDIT